MDSLHQSPKVATWVIYNSSCVPSPLSGLVVNIPSLKKDAVIAQPLVFLVCSALLMAAAYLVFRVVLRRDYARNQRLSWYSTLLECLIFLLHANLSYLFVPAVWPGLPILGTNPALNTTAFVIIAIGLAVVITGMTRLGFPITLGSTASTLRQSGLYSATRNPQIVGYGLVVVGYALLWPSWPALVWVLLYAVIAQLMVITEEEFLLNLYGDAYRRYCRRVPRYLGLPKRT